MDYDPGHILEVIAASADLTEAANKLGTTAEYLKDFQERFGNGEGAVDVQEFPLASGEAMPASPLPGWLSEPIPQSWLVQGRWPSGAKSPSWFKLIAACPRKHAKRYRYRIPDPSGLDAVVGNAFHGACRYAALLRINRRRGIPSTAGKEELLHHLEAQAEVVHDRGTEVIKRCRALIEGMTDPLELNNAWAAEFLWSFHSSPGILVAGYADLILVFPDPRNPNGPPELVLVIDYKTGPGQVPDKEELASDPQACLELIWAKRFFRNAKRVQFMIWNVCLNQKVTIDWTYAIELNTLAFTKAAFHSWNQKRETPNVTSACRYCPYRDDCKGYNKSLQAENYRPKESIENMELDALMEEHHRCKVIEDLASTRRKDLGALILQKFGPGQTKYRSNRFLALRKTRKVETFGSVSATIFRLAESTGTSLGVLLDSCLSLGDGKKLKAWIQTLAEQPRSFANDVIQADKQSRSSSPWVEVHERDALF